MQYCYECGINATTKSIQIHYWIKSIQIQFLYNIIIESYCKYNYVNRIIIQIQLLQDTITK